MADNRKSPPVPANATEGQRPKPGDPYTVGHEGSLGLLALGAAGLQLWREARALHEDENPRGESAEKEDE